MEHDAREGGRAALLNRIEEGMEVFDAAGDKIGTVEGLFFGANSDLVEREVDDVDDDADGTLDRMYYPGTDEPLSDGQPVPAVGPELPELDDVAEALGGESDIPEVLRKRLLQHGFIRIDSAGLFAGDRFAMPDQIRAVDAEGVRLSVAASELIHE